MIAFDVPKLTAELRALEEQMSQAGFWDDRERSKSVAIQVEQKRALLEDYSKLSHRLEELTVLDELARAEDDATTLQEAERDAQILSREIQELELATFLSGEYDRYNCYLSINAGAGGTDAQDWAEMLLRMYVRYLERNKYVAKVLEVSPGEVAGIKSATVDVNKPYAYGWLKGERGVHRLVRISPFDSNQRRHTSFAAVNVIPKIEDAKIEIRDEDLKIDTFKAGGAGGQYVNKTESAVRITHLPTKIVVACQSERSQHQNKEIALRMLKARLAELQMRKKQEELGQLQGELTSIEWGHQIRSYVLQPYQLVKDHRTQVETGKVEAVLDGAIDEFIEAYLRSAK